MTTNEKELTDKVEFLTQIIEDLYVNWKIGTLENYLKKPDRVKMITDIILDREINKQKTK